MATWQEPKNSTQGSSKPSRARYYPVVKPTTFSSVDQARLSLMGTEAQPILAAHTALMKWLPRFYAPEWTRLKIEDRHRALSYDLHTLRQLVETPPEEWDPPTWLRMFERLESWRGQREAAWWHLYARRHRDPVEAQAAEVEEQCNRLSPNGAQKQPENVRGSTSSAASCGMDPFLAE